MNMSVIVFQMGKVGSKSIELSLAGAGVKNVHHLHHLDVYGGVVFPDKKLRGRRDIQNTIAHARKVKAEIDAADSVKIISLVRDPIARNISAFFENFSANFGKNKDGNVLSTESIINQFLSRYNHLNCLSWFDINFKRFLDLDIYATPFHHVTKQLAFSSGKYDVLILRAEDEDSFKEASLRELMGMKTLSVLRKNSTKEKGSSIYKAYKTVRKNIRFEKSLLDTIYKSQLVTHFYTEDEVHEFRKRWDRN